MRADVPLPHAYRLLNHGPVTLVTSAAAGLRNVMAASWAMPLDFDPPKVAVVIDRNTFTRQLVEAAGEFALNIPGRTMADASYRVGSRSGRELDKFAAHGLQTFDAVKIGAPLLGGCLAWLECRVLDEPAVQGKYDLFLAEVVSAQADDQVFKDGRWLARLDREPTIHHVAGGHFFATGEPFAVE